MLHSMINGISVTLTILKKMHMKSNMNMDLNPTLLDQNTQFGRFRGWGMNKVNWLNEANLRGYTFEVLCGAFVVHTYHPEQVHEMSTHTQDLVNYYEKEYWPKSESYLLVPSLAKVFLLP